MKIPPTQHGTPRIEPVVEPTAAKNDLRNRKGPQSGSGPSNQEDQQTLQNPASTEQGRNALLLAMKTLGNIRRATLSGLGGVVNTETPATLPNLPPIDAAARLSKTPIR